MRLLFLLLVSILLVSSLQARPALTDSIRPVEIILPSQDKLLEKVINDTFFIKRFSDSLTYAVIYIEHNRHSKIYHHLLDLPFWKKKYGSEYREQLQTNSKLFSSFFKKNQHLGLPMYWMPLYPYRDSLYLYAPSDWGNTGPVKLTDSSFSGFDMDGPYASAFIDGHWINDRTYGLTQYQPYLSMDGPNAKRSSYTYNVRLHLLGKQKELLLVEYPTSPSDTKYQLYVSFDHAKDYPMIVNWCETTKQAELPFGPIDGEKLLK